MFWPFSGKLSGNSECCSFLAFWVWMQTHFEQLQKPPSLNAHLVYSNCHDPFWSSFEEMAWKWWWSTAWEKSVHFSLQNWDCVEKCSQVWQFMEQVLLAGLFPQFLKWVSVFFMRASLLPSMTNLNGWIFLWSVIMDCLCFMNNIFRFFVVDYTTLKMNPDWTWNMIKYGSSSNKRNHIDKA